jgi:hypothetical protein
MPGDFNGMLHRRPCRHRMEQAGSWPLSELHFHDLNDAFKIARELVIMVWRHHRHILTVIAKVEDHQVKVSEQILPVGKVSVSGEAVSMEKNKRTPSARPWRRTRILAPSSSATSKIILGVGSSKCMRSRPPRRSEHEFRRANIATICKIDATGSADRLASRKAMHGR